MTTSRFTPRLKHRFHRLVKWLGWKLCIHRSNNLVVHLAEDTSIIRSPREHQPSLTTVTFLYVRDVRTSQEKTYELPRLVTGRFARL
jgi:hypothetical protein